MLSRNCSCLFAESILLDIGKQNVGRKDMLESQEMRQNTALIHLLHKIIQNFKTCNFNALYEFHVCRLVKSDNNEEASRYDARLYTDSKCLFDIEDVLHSLSVIPSRASLRLGSRNKRSKQTKRYFTSQMASSLQLGLGKNVSTSRMTSSVQVKQAKEYPTSLMASCLHADMEIGDKRKLSCNNEIPSAKKQKLNEESIECNSSVLLSLPPLYANNELNRQEMTALVFRSKARTSSSASPPRSETPRKSDLSLSSTVIKMRLPVQFNRLVTFIYILIKKIIPFELFGSNENRNHFFKFVKRILSCGIKEEVYLGSLMDKFKVEECR